MMVWKKEKEEASLSLKFISVVYLGILFEWFVVYTQCRVDYRFDRKEANAVCTVFYRVIVKPTIQLGCYLLRIK